jgi:maltose alpha-D-glucosyltransferase/alpha-amylase
MQFHLLETCVYEMLYEMNNRPMWVLLPLSGLCRLVEQSDAS